MKASLFTTLLVATLATWMVAPPDTHAAVLNSSDVISRDDDWTGSTTTSVTNWDFYRFRDTVGGAGDGWQTATGSLTPLVWDGTRFDVSAAAALNQPYASNQLIALGGSLTNKTQWWDITQWTSEQDNLTLQALLDPDFTTAIRYDGGGGRQIVVAYHDVSEGTWTTLYNNTTTSGAISNQQLAIGGGAGQISDALFTLDTGDEIRVALRITSTAWGQINDRGLDFDVISVPAPAALPGALALLALIGVRRRRS